jgi:ankyrin repeat protein
MLIYYFVRHKKKYYFDAAGRKFIVSSDQYMNIIYHLMEIIQFDDQELLSKKVHDCSVGILHVRNENNQNLLHLCAIHGSIACMNYILNFERILNANDLDKFDRTPLYYLIKMHSDETDDNINMFIKLAQISDVYIEQEGVEIRQMFNDWQRRVYDNQVNLIVKV